MYRRILLPTDGSPGTDRAVDHALELAGAFDATLYVLYVVDTDVLPLDSHSRHLLDYLHEEGGLAIDRITERAEDRGIGPVTGEVREGTPHEEILRYAADNDADLIVMGTHGRRGLDRLLLGSTTDRVIRLSTVPVLAVRGPGDVDD